MGCAYVNFTMLVNEGVNIIPDKFYVNLWICTHQLFGFDFNFFGSCLLLEHVAIYLMILSSKLVQVHFNLCSSKLRISPTVCAGPIFHLLHSPQIRGYSGCNLEACLILESTALIPCKIINYF